MISRADVERMKARFATPVAVKRRKKPGTGDLAQRKAWLCAMMREPGIFIPIRTYTQGNTYVHWRVESKRTNAQKEAVRAALAGVKLPPFPVRVTLTRYAPGTLDAFGNLPSSFKHVVDSIAKAYGVDDRDPRWVFAPPLQVKTKAGQYGVRVLLEPFTEGA